MEKVDQASSLFWLAFAAAVAYGSYRLGLGTLTHPGPGFLTFWCGVILAGLAGLVFLKGKWNQQSGAGGSFGKLWAGLKWPKAIYVLLALVVYALTFVHLGFLLSTTALLIFLFKAIEPETWLRAVLSAVLASVICYLFFGIWLQVQLPRGLLEGLFFRL